MKYIVLTGTVGDPQEGVLNLSHDFGRPVNFCQIRIVSFLYPFNVTDTHIGQWLFTLNGTSLSDQDKHRCCFSPDNTRFTWGCQSTMLAGQKGVFQHEFSRVEMDTTVSPVHPIFTNQLKLTVDYRTLENGKAHTWPTREAGWDFSVSLEIVEL